MASPRRAWSSIVLALIILIISCFTLVVLAADEDALQDFCIADPSSMLHVLTLNGFPCKPASQVRSSDFASSLLHLPGTFVPGLRSAVNLASAITFPALNTQGLSIARIDLQPKGLNPPHLHPRATEVLFLAKGTLVVGFVSTGPDNTLFQQILHENDLFVFPRGLVHFQFNPDQNQHAMAISALSSQNPGTSPVAAALFADNPELPEEVLGTAFGIDQGEVHRLIASVGRTLASP